MDNDICPYCEEPSTDNVMCELCVEDYTAMAEHDAELRYYRDGRYAQ